MAPVNDNIASAIDLGGPYVTAVNAGTTVAATIESGEAAYLSGETASVWFKWTCPSPAPIGANVHVSAIVGSNHQRVRVYTGSAFGSLTLQVQGTTFDGEVVGNWFPVMGTVYLFQVTPDFGHGNTTSPFDIWVTSAPPHDAWAYAIALTGATGSQAYSTTYATRETDEPADQSGHGDGTGGTLWFTYTPTVAGVLALSTTAGTGTGQVIEIYDDTALADGPDLLAVSAIAGSATAVVVGNTYYIRVHPDVTAHKGTATLLWTFTERVSDMQLIIPAPLSVTPGLLPVRVSQGVPAEVIDFYIVGEGGTPFLSDELDVTGQLNVSIPVPSLPVGTYTLQAVTDTNIADADFDVMTAVIIDPSDPATVPPSPPPVMAIQRWYLQDPVPGGSASYTFPNNPASMTSPHPDRTLTPGATVAQSGQDLIWEGASRPHQWQFAGYAGTQEFQEVLLSFVTLNRRFYLTDHRKRSWEVSFEGLDIKQRNDLGNPWAVDYTVTAYVYSGPVQQP